MNGHAMSGQVIASTVALAGAGDETAFAALVATYHADMAKVAFVACGDRELAEDAVQSAWLVAWRKLHSLRDPERVRPWLLSVTANEARQILRRRHGPVIEFHAEVPGDVRADPLDGIERVDLRRARAPLA
jgi:RNA polymerase sigma-70 factor (ECF subfamily)